MSSDKTDQDNNSDKSNSNPNPANVISSKSDNNTKKKHAQPKTRIQSKRSFVWDFFEHPVTNGVVDQSKVRCKKCGEVKNYSSSTTNMSTHLKSKHWHLMSGGSSSKGEGGRNISDVDSIGGGLNVDTSASTSSHSLSGEFAQTSQTVPSLFQKQNRM